MTASFSAGNTRGLIEAGTGAADREARKQFSAGNTRGLIEADPARSPRRLNCRFSAGNTRGLIEARYRLSLILLS